MADDQPTILFAGGGTGGHLYPGIAVAEAFRHVLPNARVVFFCTQKEIDRVILEPTGFEFIRQPIQPLPKFTSAGALLKFWKSWRETKDLVRKFIREQKPAAVLGLGGYAAGVAVKIGALKGIPAAIINPDVIPGRANQYLMQYVKAACCQFGQTAEKIPANRRDRIQVTGCPIRDDIRKLAELRDIDTSIGRSDACEKLGLDPNLKTLLITGASLGAKTVNEAVVELFKTWKAPQGWQILHLSGREHAETVRTGYRNANVTAKVIDFTADMADIWAVSDLAIARSGASSCAELTACGVPSILMPYPFHKDLHQRANAKILADAGGAILLDDEKDARKNADKLKPLIAPLMEDDARRKAMATAARKLGHPDASMKVAKVVAGLTGMDR